MISRITGFLAAIAMAATLAVSPAHAQDQKPADAASAAVADAGAAPAPAAAPAKQENPYSLANIVAHGNVVDQVVLAILAIMSMGSWYILVVRLWDTSKLSSEAKEVRATFFKKPSLACESCYTLKRPPSSTAERTGLTNMRRLSPTSVSIFA